MTNTDANGIINIYINQSKALNGQMEHNAYK